MPHDDPDFIIEWLFGADSVLTTETDTLYVLSWSSPGEKTISVTVTGPYNQKTYEQIVTVSNADCYDGGIDASIAINCLPNGYELDVTLANGQAPYTFQYGNGIYETVMDTFFTTGCPLHDGTYELIVTDGNACGATLAGNVQIMDYTLTENCDPLTGELTLDFDFTPADATPPITYNINGDIHTDADYQFTTPVLPYDYNIQITDDEGCGISLSGDNPCTALSCNDNGQQDAGELGLDCGFGANCPQCLPLTFDLVCDETTGDIEVTGYFPTDTLLVSYPLFIEGTFSSEEYYDTTFNFAISDGQSFNIFVEDAAGRRGAITTNEIVDCTKDVEGGQCSGGQVTLSEGNVFCSSGSPDLYMVEIVIDGSSPYKILDTSNDTTFIHYGYSENTVVVGPYPMGSAYNISVLDADTCTTQISGTPPPCPTCSDGIQNQGETGVDCGGLCPACPLAPTCHNFSGYDEVAPAIISLCTGELISGGQLEVFLSPPISECPVNLTHNGNPVSGTSITDMLPGNCHEIGIWKDGWFLSSFAVTVNAEYYNDDDLQLNPQINNQLGGNCNGGINLEVTGGSGVYDFNYSANCTECSDCDGCSSVNVQSNLCSGNYAVTVTDAQSGCSQNLNFWVEYKSFVLIDTVLVRFVLEGAWLRDTISINRHMYSALRTAGLLPGSQPFDRAPWNYNGTEAVDSLAQMPINAVDWVLIEARHKKDMNTVTDRAAGILLDDGSIATPTGEPFKFLQLYENEEYYIAVRHRNHLAVMSAESVLLPDTARYDFTESLDKAMGREQMRLTPPPDALYVLCAGDANADGTISTDDYNQFSVKITAEPGYYDEDVNLDGIVDWDDFELLHGNASAIGIWQLRY